LLDALAHTSRLPGEACRGRSALFDRDETPPSTCAQHAPGAVHKVIAAARSAGISHYSS